VNVWVYVWPGINTSVSNSDSKNDAAPCADALVEGVDEGHRGADRTVRFWGAIALVATRFSVVFGAFVVVFHVRPRVTVLATLAPVTAAARMSLRLAGGVGVVVHRLEVPLALACVAHALVGCAVTPARCTRRVSCSMTAQELHADRRNWTPGPSCR
jgi:hypothetical protein